MGRDCDEMFLIDSSRVGREISTVTSVGPVGHVPRVEKEQGRCRCPLCLFLPPPLAFTSLF